MADKKTIGIYKAYLKEHLSKKRYTHSMNVANSAVELAKRYGADADKAYIAGLLHDITKETGKAAQLEIIKYAGVELHPFDKRGDKFLHQASGSAMAKILGIEDEEILDAIRYHTTGKANMTMLEQIIYLADFISADRDYKDIDIIRKETQRGIEYGLLYGTAYTIKSVASRQILLHPMTVEAYNWIIDEYFN